MKECKVCKQEKVLNQFATNLKTNVSGKKRYIRAECKPCYAEKRRSYFNEYRKTRTWLECHSDWISKNKDRYLEMQRIGQKRYEQKYPEKIKAHLLARKFIDKIKKEACEGCGSDNRLHMHHPDYSKPLEVITLCIPCHEGVHHAN